MERIPLYLAGQAAYIVTTSDRRMFRCTLEIVGKSKPELRWIFRDTNLQYIGPPAIAARYLDELQVVVEEWWQMKKDLGQKDANVTTLRAKLISEDN